MNSIYYCYILQCKDGTKYYGHTDNLRERLKEHLKGRVYCTKNRLPVELVYYEEFKTRSEAFRREMQFKNGNTRKKTIEKLIKIFPKVKCQGFNSQTLEIIFIRQL
jgi:putative endonuclease